MKLNFFKKFIDEQYNSGKIDNKYPNEKGNVMVCCPFPHTRKEFNNKTWGMEDVSFYEEVPSASINEDMGAFNCFVCGKHFNELGFAQALSGDSKEDIIKESLVKQELDNVSSTWETGQHQSLLNNPDTIRKLHELKISDSVIKELKLGLIQNFLATPVFVNGELLNVARYNINKVPNKAKVMYNANSKSGDIVPFDIWVKDPKNTLICEGEKDMLIARSHGFNAITLTGGSQASLKKEYLQYFKNKNVNIVYDNDDAGKTGALKLYKDLKDYANVNITDISSVCAEKKEDIGDFFVKYNKTREDLINLLQNNSYKPSEESLKNVSSKNTIKLSKVSENVKNSILKTSVKSSFQIIATSTDTYAIPEYAIFTLKKGLENEEIDDNPTRTWFLKDSPGDFLELMEGKVKTKDIPNLLASICGLSSKWRATHKLELGKLKTIYKCVVTDEVTDKDEKSNETTIDLYSFVPLDIGNIYEITYKLFPHPKEGQKIIAMANEIKQTEYTFDKNNNDYINSLNKFKVTTTIKDKVNELYESARCHIAPYLNKNIWFLSELVFNSPLDITYKKEIRGALDVFILGDTRTGKSETTKALKELYDFGDIVPLKTATLASLVGGTDERLKKTKLGVLPRHHKELIIMEEFSGAPMDFIKTLTEIRSSNMIKIYRIAGELQAPCKLRMITISNPMSINGKSMQLASYPNGIEPLSELIRNPEDIARYDAFMLVPHVNHLTNPFNSVVNENYKIDKVHYENKTKWIRSLGAKNVVIDNELGSYIFDKSIELNNKYMCSFTVFGSETDKKIARFSSALACLLCNTDDYEHVKVTKDHVDFVVSFIESLYNNKVFRLLEFSNEEKSFNVVVDEDTALLNEMYPKNVTLIDFLANNSRIGRNELITMSGLDRDAFNKIFNVLASRKFIKLDKDQVIPTIKFRETYNRLNRDFNLYDIK